MAYIYCIINQINNKRYVGKTVKSLEDRFREHCSDSKKERCNRRPLYDAMIKYGIENFIIEELEEVKDESILDEREKFWIDEMHTYGSNGYNATSGGDGKMLYDYNEIVELFNLGKSQKEVAELLHCDVTTVSRVLKALIPKRMQTMELRILINLTKTEIIYKHSMVLIRQLSG